MVATLLTLFVPQLCPHKNSECSFIENLTNSNKFNKVVIAFNFITLAVFIGFYIIEYYRENWYIENLDKDESLADNYLKNKLTSYPEIKKNLEKINKLYYHCSIFMVIIYIINLIMSIILISQHYIGYKTLSGLFTNIFLIVDKMNLSILNSTKSINDTGAYSAYLFEPISYNTIDSDKKRERSKLNLNIL
jgi:hypothetical protein